MTGRLHSGAMQTRAALFAVALAAAVAGCGTEWNDPYPAADRGKNFLYSSFIDRPKTLDPARSYTSDEWGFIQQIYEPPLQYHYLKRPYELVPQSALEMPRARQLDAAGQELPPDAPASAVAFTEYEIRIRPGIRYQPHPAFAVDAGGNRSISTFPRTRSSASSRSRTSRRPARASSRPRTTSTRSSGSRTRA